MPQVEVTFDIDANGILSVSAKDKASGEAAVDPDPGSSGIDKGQIEQMVKDAESHASEDKERRERIDARNQLDSMVYEAEKQLREHREKIPVASLNAVENSVASAQDAAAEPGGVDLRAEGALRRAPAPGYPVSEALYKAEAASQQPPVGGPQVERRAEAGRQGRRRGFHRGEVSPRPRPPLMRVQRGKIARELAELEEQMDRAFERALAGAVRLSSTGRLAPRARCLRDRARSRSSGSSSPALPSADVRVVVDGEYLQISGRRSFSRSGETQRHLLIEIGQGAFERVLRTRAAYDPDRVSARLENGILTIELPRRENATRVVAVRTDVSGEEERNVEAEEAPNGIARARRRAAARGAAGAAAAQHRAVPVAGRADGRHHRASQAARRRARSRTTG